MQISLDLGNTPSVLAALSNPQTWRLAINAAAESYVEDTLDWIAAGRSFTSHHGQAGLEGAIDWHPQGDGALVYVGHGYEDKNYATYVEHGTRPHVILPKAGRKGLKIPVGGGGGYIVRRKVNHPGTQPMPFFFADLSARTNRMEARMISVIAHAAGGAHG